MANKYVTVVNGGLNKQRFFKSFCFQFTSLIFVAAICDFAIIFDRNGGVAFRLLIL